MPVPYEVPFTVGDTAVGEGLPLTLPFILSGGDVFFGFPYPLPMSFGEPGAFIPIAGTIGATKTPPRAAATGVVRQPITGTIGATKHHPTFAGTGRSTFPVTGTIGATKHPPRFFATSDLFDNAETIHILSELDRLNDQLVHGDLISRADAAEILARRNEKLPPEWRITIYDKLWRRIGEVGDYIAARGDDPRNNLPTGMLKLKGDDPFIATMMECRKTMVGVTVETAGMRFPYYVDTHDYEYADGKWTGTANLLGIWDVLNYHQIWPMWFMPIQTQILSHAIYIGPICTCIENMIAEQALRIQSGLWEFVNNALSLNPDIRAWFGTLSQSNGNLFEMLKTPIYVVRTNPFFDTSPLIAKTVRMESCGTIIKDLTKAYGVDVRVDLWLPGDEQPDEWTKTIPFMTLDQPTYVVTVKDRSSITGPTGTVLDSVLRTVVDLEGSLLGDVMDPILNPNNEYVPEGMFIAPLLGLHFKKPWTLLIAPDSGEKGSITSCRITDHTPKGWQHIIGGRSPKWLNDILNALFAWILDSISILVGFTGIPSDLLAGFLNNAFFAFQLIEHYSRRNAVGPYHPAIEVFHPTQSAPYNIECVSRDTVIDGPDGKERIDVLAERRSPFRVWSITPDGETVAATATHAFKKGQAELFKFTLADGRCMSVTKDHRFLTDRDYVAAKELHTGSLIATIDGPQPVTGIESLGVDDFYDMHVPGWENYLAHGIWNHNTLFGFINAFWDSRGWTAAQATFRNGEIYTLGKDVFRGALMSVAYFGRTRLFTDYIENTAFHIDEKTRDIFVQIGDGKAQESPLAKHQRFITGVFEAINVATLAPQSAGLL